MSALTRQAQGDAAADEVWDRYVRPARWSQWSPQIRRVEASTGRIAAGTRGVVLGPLGVRATFTVEQVDEVARTWSWVVRFGPVTVRLHHAVRAETGGASTSLRIHGPWPVIVAYAPVAQVALSRLVRA